MHSQPGIGSTFTVALMLSSVAPSAVIAVPEQRVLGYMGARKTLMLVDDEPSQRGLLLDMLLPLGFELLEADSGVACLQLAAQYPVDAILLDINMPDLSGWQVVQRLREQGTSVPVIMVSANAREAHFTSDQIRYHNDYIAKPLRLQMLVDKLGQHLKLQWMVEQCGQMASALPVRRQFSASQLPSPADLNVLKALAEIGFVNGLKKKLAELSTNERVSAEFIQYVQQLVGQFQFDQIIELAGREP